MAAAPLWPPFRLRISVACSLAFNQVEDRRGGLRLLVPIQVEDKRGGASWPPFRLRISLAAAPPAPGPHSGHVEDERDGCTWLPFRSGGPIQVAEKQTGRAGLPSSFRLRISTWRHHTG